MTVLEGLGLHLAALLVGGLLSSFGLTALARRPKGQVLLARLGLPGIVLFAVVTIAGLVGGFYWLFSGLRDGLASEPNLGSPWSFFALGVVTGLPLSLPGVIALWNESRPEKVRARAEKAKSATRKDRSEFADSLARQIEELADKPRKVSASLAGEDGTVLLFEGDLRRHEGDKLVAALRMELQANGFVRVEGEGPGGKWWSKV